MNACTCPIVDRVTRPHLPCGVPNGEDSKFCTADDWTDERWEHITDTLSKLSGEVSRRSSIIEPFVHILDFDFAVPPFCP